jgi:hypothetical protein
MQGACQSYNRHGNIRESMKIAKIIDIMKTFTSSPFPVRTADNPALRGILPTLWGASPHGLKTRVERRELGPQEPAAPSGPPTPGKTRAPTASHIKNTFGIRYNLLISHVGSGFKPDPTRPTGYQMNGKRSVRGKRGKSRPAERCRPLFHCRLPPLRPDLLGSSHSILQVLRRVGPGDEQSLELRRR